ncbi:MAG: DNA polymerase III subunit epsilon [Legionellales bacterium]|nr:DNA polymerase III subunit epsilon [Legionellales bacterium]|tara:strand:- start:727 stop:1446 length:720 start_codon:yes stop_codon:yes gene_type:complete
MKLRQIALDTETTGIDPNKGHRIIEIGCVELIDRRLTGNNFHVYINPDREVDEGAFKVHGISDEFLLDKPLFREVFEPFFNYINGAQLIIHNAAFDLGFINAEFKRLAKKLSVVESYCGVIDTLQMARKLHPGQKNNLDALCKRYSIDNTHRILHGALLDAEILAHVYLAMTGSQHSLFQETHDTTQEDVAIQLNQQFTELGNLKILNANEDELKLHQKRINSLAEKNNGNCLWSKYND